MASFLKDLNSEILETHKSMGELNKSFSIAMQDSKKWTILSRFLSGTGLWAIQNKIRGLISVMGEYRKAQIKTMENQQKNVDMLDGLSTRTQKLIDAQNALASSGAGMVKINQNQIATWKQEKDAIEDVIKAHQVARTPIPSTSLDRLQDVDNLLENAQEKMKGQLA